MVRVQHAAYLAFCVISGMPLPGRFMRRAQKAPTPWAGTGACVPGLECGPVCAALREGEGAAQALGLRPWLAAMPLGARRVGAR